MRILLVEDDAIKRQDIKLYISSLNDSIQIDEAYSFIGGVRAAYYDSHDLLLLDLSLPRFDNTDREMLWDGGERIVGMLLHEEVFFRCAIITQYEKIQNETIEEIDLRFSKLCGANYLGYVKYNKTESSWKERLKNIIDHVENIINR